MMIFCEREILNTDEVQMNTIFAFQILLSAPPPRRDVTSCKPPPMKYEIWMYKLQVLTCKCVKSDDDGHGTQPLGCTQELICVHQSPLFLFGENVNRWYRRITYGVYHSIDDPRIKGSRIAETLPSQSRSVVYRTTKRE